jgi:hypothetical protein
VSSDGLRGAQREMRVTRYANLNIAYRVVGEGPLDLVLVLCQRCPLDRVATLSR